MLSACSGDDPKRELKRSFAELVTAIEQKQHLTVTNKLTKNFRGNHHFDQQTMSALVFRYYLRHKFIKIYSLINSIELEDKKEKMIFHIMLTGTENALPKHMRAFRVVSEWKKIDKDWKIAEATWIEVLPRTIYPEIKHQIEDQNVKYE